MQLPRHWIITRNMYAIVCRQEDTRTWQPARQSSRCSAWLERRRRHAARRDREWYYMTQLWYLSSGDVLTLCVIILFQYFNMESNTTASRGAQDSCFTVMLFDESIHSFHYILTCMFSEHLIVTLKITNSTPQSVTSNIYITKWVFVPAWRAPATSHYGSRYSTVQPQL